MTRLSGTVPLHQAYILLHSRHSPRNFPSRIASPLLVALRQRALRWSALVNVAWIPSNSVAAGDAPFTNDTEVYSLLAFARGRSQLRIPSVTMNSLDDACATLHDYMARPLVRVVHPDKVYLYVCTHGSRDCRCGEWGSKVADALREEIRKREETVETEPVSKGKGKHPRIVVGEVGHVGGHQHAANMLVFPYGEWLGELRPDDVPAVLDVIMKMKQKQQYLPVDLAHAPLLPTHWRGRMGLSQDEQIQLCSDSDDTERRT
ncbi:Sucrase/ferredoxin-like-domain-containing protein [Multifurca ochricompacta]|uniref:Sucrase/ferredoxin-like-domain-containing protein n=1 Tax=Multifurca ochricompacta TaxID=376703 RepID=A0AAD4QKQ5_9AGAM|nr:Sucrase/ferredoxin-like-domain-containing protein [Multifurca ochricompacta]